MKNQRLIKPNIFLRRFFHWKIFLVALISYFFCSPTHATATNIAGTQNSFAAGTNLLNAGTNDSLTVTGTGTLNANGAISAVLFSTGAGTTTVNNSGTIAVISPNTSTVMNTNAAGALGTVNITNNAGSFVTARALTDAVALNFTAATAGTITYINSGTISGELHFPFASTTVFTMSAGTLAYSLPGSNVNNLLDTSNAAGTRNATSTLNLNGGSIQGRIAGFNTFNIATNFSTGGGSDPGTITDTPNINVNSGTFTVNHAITNNTAAATAFLIANGATVQPTVANVLPATGTTTINATGNLNLGGNAQTIGDLAGAGNINTGGSTGTLTLGTANTAANYTGTISGSGGLTKQGNGNQTLSSASTNTYSGNTTVSAGTLVTGIANVLSNTSSVSVASGATLSLGAGHNQTVADLLPGTGTIDLFSSTLSFGSANTTAAFNGTIANSVGSGGITKLGTGTQTLSTANTYTGTTTISNGILIVGNNTSLGVGGTISFNGGALQSSNAVALANPFTVANNGSSIGGTVNLTLNGNGALGNNLLTINNTAGIIVLGGTLSDAGNGSITQNGLGGTLTVLGSNSYVGTTTLTNGTLNANNTTNPLGTGPLALNGGTLQQTIGGNVTLGNSSFTVSAGGSTIGGSNNLILSNAGTLTGTLSVINAGTTTLNGVIGSTGGITMNAAAGTLALTRNNNYSGTTRLTSGTLNANNANNPLGTGPLALDGGTLQQTIGGMVTLGNISFTVGAAGSTIGGAGNLTFNNAGTLTGALTVSNTQATVFSAGLGGAGSLNVSAGTVSLVAANSYLGGTTITGGTLQTNNPNIMPSNGVVTVQLPGTLNLNGNSQAIGDLIGNGNVTLGAANLTLTFGTIGTTANFAGAISGAGGIIKQNGGTQILSGNNTYGGTTTIQGGTLSLAVQNALPNANNVTISSAALLALNGNSQVIGDLSGAGNVSLGAGVLTLGTATPSTTFTGAITDTGSIIKQGTGTVIFSGPNSYSGSTTVNAGTLSFGAANALAATSNVNIAGGAVFDLNSFNQTIGDISGAGAITLGTATLTSGSNIGNSNFSGSITGSGGFIKQNAGALTWAPTVANAINFSGGLTINGGMLTFSPTAAGAINYLGGTNISGGVLVLSGPNLMPATGAVNVLANNSFSLNNFNQTIGDLSGAGNVALGTATLTLGTATPSTTFSGIISGSGSIVKQGSGTWIVTGANNYSGGTIVNAGTLQGNTNSLQGAITNNATLVFDQAVTGTYAGSISGLGTIFKENIGNVIFSGNNSCTSTIIDNGRLSVNGILSGLITVNQSGTLGGIGTINGDVINNGMVQPGNSIGTLAINGNYKPGANSITSIEINSLGQTSLLKISGNAALNGTLSVIADPGMYVGGTAYKFLTASSISGSFTAVTPTTLGPFRIVVFQLSPTVMEIVLQRTNIILGLNGANNNQIAIGNYIDGLPIPAVGSDLGDNVIGPLGNLIEGQNLFDALESISPGKNAANSVVVQDINVLVNSINAARLSSLCHPPATQKIHSPTFSLLSIKPHEEKIGAWRQRRFHSTHNGLTADAASKVQPLLQTNGAKGGGWMYSFGHFADPSANSTDPGYDSKTGGAVVGMDMSPYENIFVGLGFGYAGTTLSFDNDFGKNMIDNYFGTFYAAWTPNDWRFNASIVAGTVRFKTDQHIQFLSVNRHATADHKGIEATPHIGMGYEFAYNNMRILPFINVDYSYVYEEGYELQNALSLDQDIEKKSSGLLRSEAGIKITGHYDFDNRISGTWMPNASLSVVNKKIVKRGLTTAGFINQPGNFSVEYFTGTKNLISPGVGVILQLSNSAFLELRGDSELGKRYRTYELSLKMGILF